MRIVLDSDRRPAESRLDEPDEFGAFEVSLLGSGGATEALKTIGVVSADAGHVFVDLEHLLELAGNRAADPNWLERLEGMVGYAEEHGWTDERGRVRAHVVRG